MKQACDTALEFTWIKLRIQCKYPAVTSLPLESEHNHNKFNFWSLKKKKKKSEAISRIVIHRGDTLIIIVSSVEKKKNR